MGKTMFEAPVQMCSKKTWFLDAVAQRFVPVLRSWHPCGVNMSWYVLDRGERAALARFLRRRHLLDLQPIPDESERRMAGLLDWVMDSACADHDV